MATTYEITRVQAGQASLDNFNTPIDQIQSALNQLSSSITGINNKAAVLMYDAPLDASCSQGDLLYYDATAASFKPALAQLLATPGDQGQSVQAPSCRIIGMLVNKNSTTGTLLVGGSYTDGALAQACLGVNAVAGTYFLSSATAGKAVLNPTVNMRQPALEYYGDGKFSMGLFYMAHDNHHHAYQLISGTWSSASGDSNAPTGSTLKLAVPTSSTGQLADGITAVFYNGLLQQPNMALSTTAYSTGCQFLIRNNTLYTNLSTAPATGSVAITNVFPFAYGDSVVRTVISSNGSINVVNTNGTVDVQAKAFTAGATQNSATAISQINEQNEKSYTPVISQLVDGPGISITDQGSGVVQISSSGLVGCAVDATDYQLNASYRTTSGIYTYMTFPASRDSSIVMTLPHCTTNTTTQMTAKVWVNAIAGTGTLNVNLYFVPQGTTSTPGTLPTTNTEATLTLPVITSGTCAFVKSQQSMAFTGPGLIIASVAASSPSSDVNLLRMGFIINDPE